MSYVNKIINILESKEDVKKHPRYAKWKEKLEKVRNTEEGTKESEKAIKDIENYEDLWLTDKEIRNFWDTAYDH